MTVAGVPSVTGVGALLPLGNPLPFPLQKSYKVPVDLCRDFHCLRLRLAHDPTTPPPPCRRPSVGGVGGVQVGLLPIHLAYHLVYTGGVSGCEVTWGLGYLHPGWE